MAAPRIEAVKAHGEVGEVVIKAVVELRNQDHIGSLIHHNKVVIRVVTMTVKYRGIPVTQMLVQHIVKVHGQIGPHVLNNVELVKKDVLMISHVTVQMEVTIVRPVIMKNKKSIVRSKNV